MLYSFSWWNISPLRRLFWVRMSPAVPLHIAGLSFLYLLSPLFLKRYLFSFYTQTSPASVISYWCQFENPLYTKVYFQTICPPILHQVCASKGRAIPCTVVAQLLTCIHTNGRIYTRRRLKRPDALNVRLLSASRFSTRRLKRLRRLIHLLSASIGRTWLQTFNSSDD